MSRPLACITGASAGIGDALARLAAGLQAKHGVAAEAIEADLTRDADVSAVCARLAAEAPLELLVNNAGFGSRGFFFDADPAQQDNMHRLHVLATGRLTRAALPGMVERRRGGIVNVASVAAFFPAPGSVSYCATKDRKSV